MSGTQIALIIISGLLVVISGILTVNEDNKKTRISNLLTTLTWFIIMIMVITK